MNSILDQLNDGQRKAVEYTGGPQLVIAGAGSGKTRVLTYKIAYLLHSGMNPWNILALTFTNKAANEMKSRVGNLIGHDAARQLQMGTFHSIFSRILRVEAELIGYSSNFTIYDETDSRSLIKSIIKEMGIDDKLYKPAGVHNKISMAKNRLITDGLYNSDKDIVCRDQEAHVPMIGAIYTAYAQRCRQSNAMDFDDLLLLTYKLFDEYDDVRKKYIARFRYVLVDEYQDTNYAQQCIVLQLTKEHRKVCVVGDDAQSIYGFRGANIDNILGFQQVYKDARLFKLEQNYRSTQRIVRAANSLIKHNERQIPKEVFSKNDEGENLVYKPAYSDKEEAMIVCKDIKRIKRQDDCEYNDFAILYRANSQSRSFEEEMRRQHIPYRIYGGLSFYQRKEIKDIIAYFRIVVNPFDSEALKRIINYPTRGIGNTTVAKITDVANKHNMSLWNVILEPQQYGLEINNTTLQKLIGFRNLITDFIERMPTTDAYTLGREMIKASGISTEIYSGTDPEDLSRQGNLEEFLAGMQDFVEERREEGLENEIYLTDFLQEISLLTDIDSEDDTDSKVSLMTIHAAKGLEFPTVFVVGLEENIFPSPLSCNSMRELEEERRLLYVAITRAKKHCILTNAKNRYRFGKMEFDTPSRFLKDLDAKYLKIESKLDGEDVADEYNMRPRERWRKKLGYEYPANRPYIECRSQDDGDYWGNGHMQNSRPVAGQFRADGKPKITRHYTPEKTVDPFSDRFKRRISSVGGRMACIDEAMTESGCTAGGATNKPISLAEGDTIEHQRFGVGTVIKVEGKGENAKATVEFNNTGTKQLLLKFAKYKIFK